MKWFASLTSGLFSYLYQRKPSLHRDPAKDGLRYWRERIILAIVASATLLALAALIPGVYLGLTRRMWLLVIANISGFVLMAYSFFSRRFNYVVQSLLVLLICYAVGVIIIRQVGFLSGGPIWLFAFSVVASVLLGSKAAWVSSLLNIVALIMLGWLAYRGQSGEREFLTSISRSSAALGSFVFLNIVVSISVAVLVDGLQALNRSAAAANTALEQEKTVLLKTRERLTDEIGERKRTARDMERALDAAEAANKAKSEFLANMSHELRTPLNHIIGFSELLVNKSFGELNAQQADFLNDVRNSGHHLLTLINQILDLSKVEAGKMELDPALIHLRPLLENSLVMIKELALKQGIKLSVEVPEEWETIEADRMKLSQILYNLLSNAVKFSPDGGEVRLRVTKENDDDAKSRGLRFSVIDMGIGLEAKDLERIFLPFEQADNSASRRFQGTGLGLALTKKLVELHGGWIWAESEGPGRGSAFHFVLPLERARGQL